MKLTILGCGGSAGVPLIGCDCAVCTSDNPKNRRQRASALLEMDDGTRILVDASPDLRNQALQNNLTSIDALILTHAHADHCHGLDDVRSFNFHKDDVIDLYADQATMEEVQVRFDYIFREHKREYGWYKPCLTPHIVDGSPSPVSVAGHDVRFFKQAHGRGETLGIRVGDVAYSTDVSALSEEAFAALEGLDLWVVDCLRYTPAPTHAHLELTLSWIERLQPKRAILTHMAHELDYDTLKAEVPANVGVAYDGMVVAV